MTLFVASNLTAQTTTSCNPANCKKTNLDATSGNALINLMTAISNGTYVNQVTSSKEEKPNCNPKAYKKAKTGEAKLVSILVEEGKSYTMNPTTAQAAKGSLNCDPALCEKICAGNPNCSPKDCAKACSKKTDASVDKETTKL